MIRITLLNDRELVINAHLIEQISATPDTNITMTTGRKVLARESVDEVIEKVIAYNKKIFTDNYKS